jgi:NAD(P)-dependent dehydrogenase (short-subunit alcohol dehydrogenase family)
MLSRDPQRGQAALDEVTAAARFGGEAAHLPTDVSVELDAERAVAATVDRWGRLDGMFNAAGLSGRRFGDGAVAECTLEGWETVIRHNLTGIFLCCKHGIRAMLETGGGAIVNLSSVLGLVGGDDDFGTHAYVASKGGIVALTRAIASYYAPRRIRANALCPGLIRTPMSLRAQQDPGIVARLPDLQPLTGDFGTPQDVAMAALYLLSDEAAFVTGAVLTVDGGWTTR